MDNDNNYRYSAIAWFAALERARDSEDFELAAEAQRQLRRLGVLVIYRRQQEVLWRLFNYCGFLYSGLTQLLRITNGKSKKK